MYSLVFILFLAAIAYGLTYLMLMSTNALTQQNKLIVSGVSALLVGWAAAIGYIRL